MADEPLQKLTAEELATWTPMVRAVRQIETVLDPYTTINALLRRLIGGQLRSGAESHTFDQEKGGIIEIAPARWSMHHSFENDVWRTGILVILLDTEGYGYRRPYHHLTYYDVRFEPSGLAKMMVAFDIAPPPPAPPAPTTEQAMGSKGGRRATWWRALVLIELAGQLYEGDLKPKKLADLEKAASDWLARQGEYPGEHTVRNVVTPLWERISKEGKDSTG